MQPKLRGYAHRPLSAAYLTTSNNSMIKAAKGRNVAVQDGFPSTDWERRQPRFETGPPKYEIGILTTHQRRSVVCTSKNFVLFLINHHKLREIIAMKTITTPILYLQVGILEDKEKVTNKRQGNASRERRTRISSLVHIPSSFRDTKGPEPSC